MTSIESSNTLNSSIDKYSHNSTEPNKKISKIKLKKTNNLQDNNELEAIKEQISCTESAPLFVEILKDNINPKLKIKGSIKINIKKI
jgi:methyltransferase-like protein